MEEVILPLSMSIYFNPVSPPFFSYFVSVSYLVNSCAGISLFPCKTRRNCEVEILKKSLEQAESLFPDTITRKKIEFISTTQCQEVER